METFNSMDEAYLYEVDRLECKYNEKLDEAKKNIVVKKCSSCGKYFVVKNLHGTDCCSRKCQQAFADAKQREKINNHPILKLYTKVNKRMSARKRNGKLTKEEYSDWIRKYSDLRNEYAEKYNNERDECIKKSISDEFSMIINESTRREVTCRLSK